MHEIPARRHRRSRTALPALLAAGCVSASTTEARAAELLACEGTEIDLRAILEEGSPPTSFAIESDSLDDGSILVSHAAFSAVFEDGIPFFGQRTHFYANNNGNITFGEPMTSYTPDAIPGLYQPTIAPWFGDVDFHAASGDWTMCVEPDNQRMMIT